MLFHNFYYLFKIILISIVEGVTEFLPVSSTAHILVLGRLMKVEIGMEFLVGIQLGAILAVCVLYFSRIKEIIVEIFTLKFNIVTTLIIITVPTCFFGAMLSFANYLAIFPKYTICVTLIVGGIIMLYFQKYSGKIIEIKNCSYKKAFIIGCVQAISLIPGVSRSASVIVGGLVCGMSRFVAIELSFLSGVPIIFAATTLELCKGYKNNHHIQSYNTLLLGFVVAFCGACIGIWLLKILANAKIDFKFFGIYRIIMGCLLFFII